MNNAGFGKTMKNVAKHRYIKLLATKTRKNHLVSEPNYYTTKFFTENFFGNRNEKNNKKKKTEILFILELSKILIYEF